MSKQRTLLPLKQLLVHNCGYLVPPWTFDWAQKSWASLFIALLHCSITIRASIPVPYSTHFGQFLYQVRIIPGTWNAISVYPIYLSFTPPLFFPVFLQEEEQQLQWLRCLIH